MQERNIINGTTTALVSPLLDFYENLIPFLLLAIVLIFVDSRFGVAAARFNFSNKNANLQVEIGRYNQG